MVGKAGSGEISITEEMVARYHSLNEEAKVIEKELAQLKKRFNEYFDQTVGQHAKGELLLGDYKLQRQIRRSERYIDDKAVHRLEELNMADCIQITKRPDKEKIQAAIKLGLLSAAALDDCKHHRVSEAIYVREV